MRGWRGTGPIKTLVGFGFRAIGRNRYELGPPGSLDTGIHRNAAGFGLRVAGNDGQRTLARRTTLGLTAAGASNAEFKEQDVAVAYEIIPAFHAVVTCFPGSRYGALLNQIIVLDGFGFNESAFEIGVN